MTCFSPFFIPLSFWPCFSDTFSHWTIVRTAYELISFMTGCEFHGSPLHPCAASLLLIPVSSAVSSIAVVSSLDFSFFPQVLVTRAPDPILRLEPFPLFSFASSGLAFQLYSNSFAVHGFRPFRFVLSSPPSRHPVPSVVRSAAASVSALFPQLKPWLAGFGYPLTQFRERPRARSPSTLFCRFAFSSPLTSCLCQKVFSAGRSVLELSCHSLVGLVPFRCCGRSTLDAEIRFLPFLMLDLLVTFAPISQTLDGSWPVQRPIDGLHKC